MKKLGKALLAALLVIPMGACRKESSVPTPEELENIEEDIISQISGDIILVGDWKAEDKDDLYMNIVETDDNEYDILISWAKNDTESDVWTIHGSYDSAMGSISYDDGEYALVKLVDGETVRENEEKTTGSLGKISDTQLIWNDSHSSDTSNITFAQIGIRHEITFAEGPYEVTDIYAPALKGEDIARFETAVYGQIGVKYTPVQVLATQVVSGTNYAYLAYGEFSLYKKQNTYAVITVYEDLNGNVEGTGFEILDVNDVATKEALDTKNVMGGWAIADNEEPGINEGEAYDAVYEAFNPYTGDIGNIVTIALLGTAEENGTTSYRYLARGTNTEIAPDKTLYIIDLEKASDTWTVKNVQYFDLLTYVKH